MIWGGFTTPMFGSTPQMVSQKVINPSIHRGIHHHQAQAEAAAKAKAGARPWWLRLSRSKGMEDEAVKKPLRPLGNG